MTSALACFNVTKAFDASGRGVFDVSLTVPAGSAHAILGPNGSGKTTIINLCLGYLAADAGRVEIWGTDIAAAAMDAKMRTAYVPEIARLYPHLSALEHFALFDRFLGFRGRTELHLSVLDTLHFPRASASDRVLTYSKGMRQKVAIALGLLKGADVFLLDEPTSGLDPKSSADFKSIVQSLKQENKAVLLCTHDVIGIAHIADRVSVVQNGRIVYEGDAPDPAHLLAEMGSHG